jgi:glycosyltransferase involved in cell wall biosynthesis
MLTSRTSNLVTVIIPVRNGRRFIEESLMSAENQIATALEILVVDDGSDDGSGDIARARTGVRVIRQKPGGVGAARNAGIEAAHGQYIAFLDADDLWHPEKTIRQLAALQTDPNAGGSLCRFRNFLDPHHPPPKELDTRKFMEEAVGSMPSLVTLLADRETVKTVGLFRTDLVSGEDLDWFARARDMGIFFTRLPEILVERRLHNANLSYQSRKDHGHILEIIKASIERKRASERESRAGMTGAERRYETES